MGMPSPQRVETLAVSGEGFPGKQSIRRISAHELAMTVEAIWSSPDRKFWNAVADLVCDGHSVAADDRFVSRVHRLVLASRESADDNWRQSLARAAANAVCASDFSDREVERFTEIVASYTPSHVALLQYFNEPGPWLHGNPGVRHRQRGVFVIGGYQRHLAAFDGKHFADESETARIAGQLQTDGLVQGEERRHHVYDAAIVPSVLAAGKRLLEFVRRGQN